jgi:hypothetical protein
MSVNFRRVTSSPEKIKQIQENIAISEAYMKSVQDAFKK